MGKNDRVRLNLEKRSLHIFRELLAVHDSQTMSAAAKQMGMSLATLSRNLQDFHDGPLGQTLLVKDNKSWKLAPRGEAALPAIRDLVRQYEQLIQFLTGDEDAPHVIRIGLGNFAAQHYFPQALIAARERAMQLDVPCLVESEVLRGRDRILGVHDGLFDIAIVSHTPEQVHAILDELRRPLQPLTVEPLAQHPFCVVARRDSPAGKILDAHPTSGRLPMKELARVELVGLDPQSGIRRRLEQQLHAANRAPLFIPGTGAGGWYAAKEFARNGLGAAVVPLAIMTETDQRDFMLRHLPSDVTVDEYLIYRSPLIGSPSQARQELIAMLRTTAADFRQQTIRRWSAKR